jgi:hypothetical protein
MPTFHALSLCIANMLRNELSNNALERAENYRGAPLWREAAARAAAQLDR